MDTDKYPPKHRIGEVSGDYLWTGAAWVRIEHPWYHHVWLATIVILVTFFVGGSIYNYLSGTFTPGGPAPEPSASPTAFYDPDYYVKLGPELKNRTDIERAAEAAGFPYGGYPEDEAQFVAVIVDTRAALEDIPSLKDQAAAVAERDEDLIDILGRDLSVDDWVGRVLDKGKTAEGFTYVAIEITRGGLVRTWYKLYRDFDDTLIRPDNLVFESLEDLGIGDNVLFSGHFTTAIDDDNALAQGNWTDRAYGLTPEFIFNFEQIEPGLPPIEPQDAQ